MMSEKEEQKANYYPDLIKLDIFWFVFHTLQNGGKAACVSRMYVRQAYWKPSYPGLSN